MNYPHQPPVAELVNQVIADLSDKIEVPKKPFRLVLTPEQSAAIRESGIGFVAGSPYSINVVTGPATLLLFECDQEAAEGACDVAMGLAKARPIATRHKPPSAQPGPI